MPARREIGSAAFQGHNPFDRPMRWANLTLVEDDPGTIDLGFWLDYLERCRIDALCLSAGGCVAYYPTDIAHHHRSRWLDRHPGGDPFGDLVAGCRKRGILVTARVDSHSMTADAFAARPDWAMRLHDGRAFEHWLTPGRYVTCCFGDYAFGFMPQVVREIASRYDVAGVFANRWNGSGVCYCESCRRQFRQSSGMDIPPPLPRDIYPGEIDWRIDPDDPAWRAYARWRRDRLFAVWDCWEAAIRSARPTATFIPNMGGGIRNILDMSEFGRRALYLTADRQGRQGNQPPWTIGIAAREFRSVLGSKPLGGGFSLGPFGGMRWMDSVHGSRDGLPEPLLWAAEAVAHGIRPSWGKTGLRLDDIRWLDPIASFFQWHARNDRYFRNTTPLANVAVLFSQQTAMFGPGSSRSESPMLGLCQALTEARIPFEFVHENLLDRLFHDDGRPAFASLLLPDVACLSERQCDPIRRFVHAGGGLLATHRSSLHDEQGRPRGDFALADLFGCHFDHAVEGPLRNAWCRLERPDPANVHPILRGFDGAEQIIHPVHRVRVRPSGQPLDAVPLTFIPPFPSLPMEELYRRVDRTNEPVVFLRRVGLGRVGYVPGDLDRTCWGFLIEDHARLIENLVRWCMGDALLPVEVEGPGFIDVTAWRQSSSLTVHLVNLNNAMTMRGYFRGFIPAGPYRVRLRLPDDARVSTARLLVADRVVPFTTSDRIVELVVDAVTMHEVVALDLAD